MKLKTLLIAMAMVGAGIGSGHTAVVTSTNVPVTICDLCTVTSTLNVTSHIILTDVNVLLTNLMHTFDNDLRITLTAPNATQVLLSNRRGGGADNFINTVFDDSAAISITAGAAPFTGTFRPEELLAALNGMDAFGTWTLTVADLAGQDVGSINNWGLDINGRLVEQGVPEPGALALVSLALLGLGLSRRKHS